MLNELEVYSIFYLYDKLVMSDVQPRFTEDLQFFFQYCITSKRQDYLLHQGTFEIIKIQLQNKLDDQHRNFTNILFGYLVSVLVSLQSRLHSETLITDKAVHFIQQNMKFFSLELFYVLEALNSTLNSEGSLFQCARFVCSITRISLYLSSLIGVLSENSLSAYIHVVFKHLSNLTKATLYNLRPYQDCTQDQCLCIVDLFIKIKQELDPTTAGRLAHVYNEVTFKQQDMTREKIMKYNESFFDTYLNQQKGYEQVTHFQGKLSSYLKQKKQNKPDYSSMMRQSAISDDSVKEQQDQVSDILLKSKKFRQSENNPYKSPLAARDPDLMMNQHDLAEVAQSDGDGPQMQFRLSKIIENTLASEQSQTSKNSLRFKQFGSLEVERNPNHDPWRSYDISQLTDQQHRPSSFKIYQEEFDQETEQDQNMKHQ